MKTRISSQQFLATLLGMLAVIGLQLCVPGVAAAADDINHKQRELLENAGDLIPDYPIDRINRPYQDVHPSVAEAWNLVEIAYLVISKRYAEANQKIDSNEPELMAEGSREKQELTKEIQTNIFFVEDDIEALFKKAIEKETDNPLNYAAYAYYLKPRKRVVDSGIVDTEPEALEMVNKAIELWPDESAFYLLKIHILIEPHRAHTWVRTGAMEQLSISERIPSIEELFELAEKYDPQNHYIDYYHALTLAKFALPEDTATIAPKILDELREGNRKHFGFFVFPPPLEPYNMQASRQQILSETVDPVYYDQWNLFGFYEYTTIMRLINIILSHYSWPEDKDQISEVMYFLFNIGRTVPFNRTAFSLQFMLLDMIHKSLAPDSPESIKISQAIRYLQRLYRDAAQELYVREVITDSTKLNVQGLELIESKYMRYGPLRATAHKRHANFLWKVQDILEIELPLPEDPSLW